MSKARVNGVDLYYEMAGQGHPLTLVHGFSGLTNTWDGQFGDLSNSYRVIRYDLRGQGQSEVSSGGYSMDDWASDLYHLLCYLNIERTYLVGHSMGGHISLKFTLDHPEMVDALVVVAGNAGPVNDLVVKQGVGRLARIAAYGVESLVDELLPVFYSPDFVKDHPEHIEGWKKRLTAMSDLGVLGSCTAMMAKPSLLEELPNIMVPTLIIGGEKDISIPVKVTKALHKGISNSRLVVFPNGSHMAHEEQPQAFNSIVSEFLESIQAG